MRHRTCLTLALLAVLGACALDPAGASKPSFETTLVNQIVPTGGAFDFRIEGLRPGTRIKIHSLRLMEEWRPNETGEWAPTEVPLHAWAEFAVPASGDVDISAQAPLHGTWREADSKALFWSGRPVSNDADLVPEGMIRPDQYFSDLAVGVEYDGELIYQDVFFLTSETDDLVIENVRDGTAIGAFAYPKGAVDRPLVIILHGSEGSGEKSSREAAALFARQGFAAFALAYYTRPHLAIPGVPSNGSVNRPVELLDSVRTWAEERDEVDIERIGVRGVSKGAELALVAGSEYDWIDAIVACVPSNIVWQGFGREPQPGEIASSWSIAGKPLPYLPYAQTFEEFAQANPGASASDWHRATRDGANPGIIEAAKIPVENISGAVLLIAGEKDEVWPSADMTRALEDRAAQFKMTAKMSSVILERGNHQICGPGEWPTHLYLDENARNAADPIEVGHAAVKGWDETVNFLKANLSSD